jgi:hypothetical protein
LITCECGVEYPDGEQWCPSCGLENPEFSRVSDATPRSAVKQGREVGQVEPQTTFQPLPGATPEQKRTAYRLKRITQRRGIDSKERTANLHARLIRAEAARQGIKATVVVVAILLNKRIPSRTSNTTMDRRVSAALIVGSWSLGHHVDLSKNHWDDPQLRKIVRALAESTGTERPIYTASDYLRANAVVTIQEPPWTLTLLTRSELYIARLLSEQVDWPGSPRTLAAGIVSAFLRMNGRPIPLKVIADAFGCAPSSVLRAEHQLEALVGEIFGDSEEALA